MVTTAVTETNKQKSKGPMIDIEKLVSQVQSSYGIKEKSLANQVNTGSSITRPTKESEFVVWKNSPWSELTSTMGLPLGRIVQIAGRPDSGKSSHAMKFMQLAQDQGFLVILWDTEGKFSANRFDKYFGGDSSKLVVITSRMILEGGSQIERVVHAAKKLEPSCKVLIVHDSVGGALPKNEDEGSLENTKQMAAAAKENGAVVRAYVRLMEQYKNREKNEESIGVLLINQSYANIGAPGQKESGGQKVEYHSSLILQLTRKKDLTKVVKGVKRKVGIVSRGKVKKNHLFDGESSIAEMDLVVTAGGIELLSKQKVKKESDDDLGMDDGEVELEEDDSDE